MYYVGLAHLLADTQSQASCELKKYKTVFIANSGQVRAQSSDNHSLTHRLPKVYLKGLISSESWYRHL